MIQAIWHSANRTSWSFRPVFCWRTSRDVPLPERSDVPARPGDYAGPLHRAAQNGRQAVEPARILTHFESDYGAAPKVEMRKGQVVTNIIPDFASERYVGLLAEIVDNPFLPICRSQIDVQYSCSDQQLAEVMPGFHWITGYGDYMKEVGYALKKVGIQWQSPGLIEFWSAAAEQATGSNRGGRTPRIRSDRGESWESFAQTKDSQLCPVRVNSAPASPRFKFPHVLDTPRPSKAGSPRTERSWPAASAIGVGPFQCARRGTNIEGRPCRRRANQKIICSNGAIRSSRPQFIFAPARSFPAAGRDLQEPLRTIYNTAATNQPGSETNTATIGRSRTRGPSRWPTSGSSVVRPPS